MNNLPQNKQSRRNVSTVSNHSHAESNDAPAMGERRARWGYGYQDRVATDRILDILRNELRLSASSFRGVRLADIAAGRVDDFVLIWETEVQGNSIKWSANASEVNWGELIGANGLLKELSDGYRRLTKRWSGKKVTVRLQTNRPYSTQKQSSQLISNFSVGEFIQKYWRIGPSDGDTPPVADAWAKIAHHVGLNGVDLSQFVSGCELIFNAPQPPVKGPDTQDMRAYLKQFDGLHKAIAVWLTNNPREEIMDRQSLWAAIGLPAYNAGLVQRFPQPQIPYEANHAAANQLEKLVNSTKNGYIAVTGPAGIGKSTLVQDVLAESPFFIPYFAYLPDGEGNPRDRGEALTFFQDVIARLHKFFAPRLSLGIADVAQGRQALREYMKKAQEAFIRKRQKTILLIDGLDHVAREVGLQRSLLSELPRPDEVPEGFLIILSSQPQALQPGILERHVSAAVAPESKKRIEVGGLSRPEVHEIVQKISRQTKAQERDALFDACQGNPLILTYLLRLLEGDSSTTVYAAITSAGQYAGDIEQYYRSALDVSLGDSQTRQLLALLSRAVPIIPISWLQGWPERGLIESLYTDVLAPFVRVDDGNLLFIHNSLVAFLKDETRSRLPEANSEQDERFYHSELADRCGEASCSHLLGRAKVFHLLRASRNAELLALLSSEWLREGIDAFLPYSELRPLLLNGFSAAWKLSEYGEVLRLILVDFELSQRTSRMDPGDLARKFLELNRPAVAVSQIRAAGRVLVDDKDALAFARHLWHYGLKHENQELEKLARSIYLQAKPVGFIYQTQGNDLNGYSDLPGTLHEWADAAPAFETASEIIAQIARLKFERPMQPHVPSSAEIKSSLLYAALQTALSIGWDEDTCKPFLNHLVKLRHKLLLFAGLMATCAHHPSERLLNRLERIHKSLPANADVDLKWGELLVDLGQHQKARTVIGKLRHIACDSFQTRHSFGLTDISFTVTLRRLQEILGLDEGPLPPIKDAHAEAAGRVAAAARLVGVLFARQQKNQNLKDLGEGWRSLLLFHNRPVAFPEYDWRDAYTISRAKPQIYRLIVRLAARLGAHVMEALRDEFLRLIQGPAAGQFLPSHRRLFAAAFFQFGALDQEQASKLGLSTIADADEDDPGERQQACLEIAVFLHHIGMEAPIHEWILRASRVSAGAGSNKDYHMALLAKWLSLSVGTVLDDSRLTIVEKFARAIDIAGGEGRSDAAARLLRSTLGLDPRRAVSVAVELIDRDILDVSETLEALLIAAASGGGTPPLLVAVYCELLSLVHPGDTSEVAVAILRTADKSERIVTAYELMKAVRTNALPPHRIETARALQDAVRKDELGDIVLTAGLITGADDSVIKNSLYKLADGSKLTIGQVAIRLSAPDEQAHWNPNSSENSEFDWWQAIKEATIKHERHMNALLSTFPVPDYRKVELHAWKSQCLFQLGDREAALREALEARSHAKDGSWIVRLDGGQQRIAYEAMKRFHENMVQEEARRIFGNDLSSGKLYSLYLLDDIIDIFKLLKIEWPGLASLRIIDDYLDGVLAANRKVSFIGSLQGASAAGSVDEAICRFVLRLLAFPVSDVGIAARRALTRYAYWEGGSLVPLFKDESSWDSVQLEHLLVCVQIGLRAQTQPLLNLRDQILKLNVHKSLAVRAIARRICADQGWTWQEIRGFPKNEPLIVAPRAEEEDLSFEETLMLVDGDITFAFKTFHRFMMLLEDAGLEAVMLRSEFARIYLEVEKNYLWADEKRLKLWLKLVFANFWQNTSVMIGREASMRVLGFHALSGEAPIDIELAYDCLGPIYDPALELMRPIERPSELKAMDWDSFERDGERWRRGEGASDWVNYPMSVRGLYVIGEKTYLIRPEWEWPREERYRGLFDISVPAGPNHEKFTSQFELTYDLYLRGVGQSHDQLIVWNSDHHLVGSPYRWCALSTVCARALGWVPSDESLFGWVDSAGVLMVKSIFWRDGWIGLKPPRFEALGEGWVVLATSAGLEQIRRAYPSAQTHLWVERHSHGKKPYCGAWHLSRSIIDSAEK